MMHIVIDSDPVGSVFPVELQIGKNLLESLIFGNLLRDWCCPDNSLSNFRRKMSSQLIECLNLAPAG